MHHVQVYSLWRGSLGRLLPAAFVSSDQRLSNLSTSRVPKPTQVGPWTDRCLITEKAMKPEQLYNLLEFLLMDGINSDNESRDPSRTPGSIRQIKSSQHREKPSLLWLYYNQQTTNSLSILFIINEVMCTVFFFVIVTWYLSENVTSSAQLASASIHLGWACFSVSL